jgi:hypothetical protein
VSVQVRTLLTLSSTLVTPVASVAVAAMVTVEPTLTLAPLAGDVMETAGVVTSLTMTDREADVVVFPAAS